MNEHSADNDRITTDITEWVVQCVTRDGSIHTGNPKISRKDAQESGERLERINGAEWWLASRRRIVTVETFEWEREPVVYRSSDLTADLGRGMSENNGHDTRRQRAEQLVRDEVVKREVNQDGALTLFLAVDFYDNPGIWSEHHEDDPRPELVIERVGANAAGFDALANLITDWRCEDWR